MRSRLYGALAVLSVLAFWELAVRAGWAREQFLTPPSRIVPTIKTLIADGTLLTHTRATMERVAVGFGISVVLGVTAGTICAVWKTALWTFGTVVETIRAIPSLALLPAFMLFFGIGFSFPVAIVVWVAWVPIFLNTIHGIQTIDEDIVGAARVDGASSTQIARLIFVPLARPAILTGMRLGLGNAFVVIVVAEMIGSTSGLGYYIFDSMQRFHTPEMYAAIVTLGFVAWLCNAILVWIARIDGERSGRRDMPIRLRRRPFANTVTQPQGRRSNAWC